MSLLHSRAPSKLSLRDRLIKNEEQIEQLGFKVREEGPGLPDHAPNSTAAACLLWSWRWSTGCSFLTVVNWHPPVRPPGRN